jgi:hypothetical protein
MELTTGGVIITDAIKYVQGCLNCWQEKTYPTTENADLAYYRKTDSDVMDELGKHCFVAKPVDNRDLINRLKVVLSQK